jgi:hypothetical protein
MEQVSEANSDPSFASGFVPVSVKDISVNNARARYAAKKSRNTNKINAQFVTRCLKYRKGGA